MTRLLLCLPFFLFFALLYPRTDETPEDLVPGGETAKVVKPSPDWFGLMASTPAAGFPSGITWTGLYKTMQTSTESRETLPEKDIVRFLEMGVERYEREVQGYTATLYKRERVKGKLNPHEVVHVEFKENPHSVYMKWLENPGQATAVLYVKGQNNDKMLAKPKLLPWLTWREDVKGEKAKSSGRYTIDQFGIKLGTERVLQTWKKKQAEGKLHAEYEGVFYVAQAGNRPCYKIHRTKFEGPEDDGVMDVVLYIDTETWLQVGTILTGQKGELIAEYFFRDIRLNPDFPPGHFHEKLLSK